MLVALLTSLFWLLGGSASNAAALQAEGRIHLSRAPGCLLHLLHMSLHQLSRDLLANPGKLLCRQRGVNIYNSKKRQFENERASCLFYYLKNVLTDKVGVFFFLTILQISPGLSL